MTEDKHLVVIVDEEARKNLKDLKFRWFSNSKERNDKPYLLENPLGTTEEVTGTLVTDHQLQEHAAEYLYLEITSACQLRCQHCGIKSDLSPRNNKGFVDNDAPYITDDFVTALERAIHEQPSVGLQRKLFFGGGEPLISPLKFAEINLAFSQLERTTRVATTNGLNLPLDERAFADFIDGPVNFPYVMFSCSGAHIAQYTAFARGGKFPQYIPDNVNPEKALYEKARVIEDYCQKLSIGFTSNVVEPKAEHRLQKDLRAHILQAAQREPKIFGTEVNGHRDPCSQAQELAIRSNGRLYPHCYDVFNGTFYIGKIGLLVGEKSD
ncbi:MAG: hypothetical protein KKH52_04475 [Nanoarchaeota archaeon]|nr:hypothetical protein [Nanoarchaeota archaeon]MBU1622076.1 hypothetical protein [Nanoarchaeota archaeon]MBU1974621.1 hypothetical protein [Nanoarchaeota archaeon]